MTNTNVLCAFIIGRSSGAFKLKKKFDSCECKQYQNMIVSNASVWSKYVDLLLCKKGVIHLKKTMFFFKTWTFFETWIYFVFQPNALNITNNRCTCDAIVSCYIHTRKNEMKKNKQAEDI